MPTHIHIVGTSHIAKQSIQEVRKAIKELKPAVVAIELDRERAEALLHPELRRAPSLFDIRTIGFKGWLFAKLGHYVEHSLGASVGVEPGAEMKAAMEEAKIHKAHLALIDRPITQTLSRLSSAITWREKFRFLGDVVSSPFQRKQLRFDLKKVPEHDLITVLLAEVKVRYPSVYRVLVSERNSYMVRKLQILAQHHPEGTIVVVVGAGHVEGMRHLLMGHPAQAG